jgi:hypothetical protein
MTLLGSYGRCGLNIYSPYIIRILLTLAAAGSTPLSWCRHNEGHHANSSSISIMTDIVRSINKLLPIEWLLSCQRNPPVNRKWYGQPEIPVGVADTSAMVRIAATRRTMLQDIPDQHPILAARESERHLPGRSVGAVDAPAMMRIPAKEKSVSMNQVFS